METEALVPSRLVCQTDGIRTTLDIDGRLMEALMARFPDATKTEAIQNAIEAYLRRQAIEDLIAMAGTVDFDDAFLGEPGWSGWRTFE